MIGRLAERPLLTGTGFGAVLSAILLLAAAAPLDRRAEALRRIASADAVLAAPARATGPLVGPGQEIAAGDAQAAIAARRTGLIALARANGLLPEAVTPAPAAPGLVALKIRVSGSEDAVLAFADTIEREPPLSRFRSVRIEAIGQGALRLDGEVVAAWR